MSLVALQPCANVASQKHFEDTINNSVSLTVAEKYLSKETMAELRSLYPSGEMHVWGATPGEGLQHVKKWQRLGGGDFIAFAAKGRIFAGAVVTSVFRSEKLAQEIWGETTTINGVSQTWELMFAVTEIQELDVPYEVLNALIGRKEHAAVQEFNVLSEESSSALLEYLNRAENSFQEPTLSIAPTFTPEFEQMELEVITLRRVEQQILRKELLKDSPTQCELCARSFPAEFLTAAHIKRRSLCTPEEKVQLTAVAMLNCRFGCDELFGKGYVSVDGSGKICVSDALSDEVALDYAEHFLRDRQATAWEQRPTTHIFFEFHFKNDFRRTATGA